MAGFYDTHIPNPLVRENAFVGRPPERAELPLFAEICDRLPAPFWGGHPATLDCYWKVWELAFRNLRQPTTANGFVANYIDTAFNDCLFMWDSVFILLFARYGSRAFCFQRTLDNLYAKQHKDGYICREVREADGQDQFSRFDPASTGPNVMPWSEWEYYLSFGDRERLAQVFPVLLAYHQWFSMYRTWPDGTYWASGWACGMDNQPRVSTHLERSWWYHGHLAWVDTCMQQAFSARLLLRMAEVLGRSAEVADLRQEAERLARAVNETLWDDRSAFYYDRRPDGGLSTVKTVGAYWALVADLVPAERLPRFIAHLEEPAEFNRPHRVPSLAGSDPSYRADGGYWLGGVWPPTNYMVLRGLQQVGYDTLAHEIALNHLGQVVRVFEERGTVFENYAPETAAPGQPAKGDFVGWGGLGPVAVFLEYVLGLRPDVGHSRLFWDVRLTEEHGVYRYPFGANGLLDLACQARASTSSKPQIRATATVPLELVVRWDGGSETLSLGGG
jgi:glycogen debranching enzyme